MTEAQRQLVEDKVNDIILLNDPVQTKLTTFDEAIEEGVVALFGEKYGDEVRVLSMGSGYSVELCGGTHVDHVGEIGLFKVVSESGIAAGVRRIEAITGRATRAWFVVNEQTLDEVSGKLKAGRDQLTNRIGRLLEEKKTLQTELENSRRNNVQDQGSELASSTTTIGEVNVLATRISGDAKSMMSSFDDVRSRLDPYVVVLATVEGQRCQVVCGVSKSLAKQVAAGDVIKHLGSLIDVRGGGKPDYGSRRWHCQ